MKNFFFSFDCINFYNYSVVLISFLLFILTLALASCGKSSNTDKSSETKNNTINFSEIKSGEPIRVGPKGCSSSFSYYNTTPENPEGSKIAYVTFNSIPKNDRNEKVNGGLWICNTNLSSHKKITNISNVEVHNGSKFQWVDNETIAYQDDSIRMVNLNGKHLIPAFKGHLGHHAYNKNILFSTNSKQTGLSTIYQKDKVGNEKEIADVEDFKGLVDYFDSSNFKSLKKWSISHLQYAPNGQKIAFRLNVGPKTETYKHLVIFDLKTRKTTFFGPKPMHFSWYDNKSIMGHDNQIADGKTNDNTLRRWDLRTNYLETLGGSGNHLGASNDREYFASESWYGNDPVILKLYRHGDTTAFWQHVVSNDKYTTWNLAFHTNPSFSRDGKRLYFNKCVGSGVVKTFMVLIPDD
ncbi:WD40 repeat protein [Jejuia pallidilutea]|uniref:WD40 repeat protein n=1 Tax=Jejuia pallidilutea TaxID=504487 RepID=A0A362X3Q5_9FLAO|nr:PD40 domain-containing protein [Jejuia pallidilutea]PQV51528.1 WD40 repeat protein [Jejuia pallidilutea]